MKEIEKVVREAYAEAETEFARLQQQGQGNFERLLIDAVTRKLSRCGVPDGYAVRGGRLHKIEAVRV